MYKSFIESLIIQKESNNFISTVYYQRSKSTVEESVI